MTKKAIDLLLDKKIECGKSQTCEKRRYITSKESFERHSNESQVYVAFDNPEVEYHNTYISYDLLSLIGEVGGILGLTLGASAVTMFDSILHRIPYY